MRSVTLFQGHNSPPLFLLCNTTRLRVEGLSRFFFLSWPGLLHHHTSIDASICHNMHRLGHGWPYWEKILRGGGQVLGGTRPHIAPMLPPPLSPVRMRSGSSLSTSSSPLRVRAPCMPVNRIEELATNSTEHTAVAALLRPRCRERPLRRATRSVVSDRRSIIP